MNNDKNKNDPIIPLDDPIIPLPEPTVHDPVLQQQSESTAVTVDTKAIITPITRKEIPQVDAAEWDNLTVGELYLQLEVLETRKAYCNRHAVMLVGDIQLGIKKLELIIKKKSDGEIKLI